MAQAGRDQNFVPTLLGVSNSDGTTPIAIYADPNTHRLLVDSAGGTGTVTSVSVVTANGFAGTVATATTTPAITLSTTVTGILQGNGTAISAATAGTDYTNLAFKTISVSGQSDVVADSAEDTLTLAAGTNITITTNASTDTITIAASGSTGVSSVVGTSNRITVNSTDPANPIVDIAATYVGQTSITTLGTIATGTWAGTTIAVNHGGTGGTSAGITLFNNITGFTAAGATGTTSTNLVFSTSPTLVTPTLGAATATSINKMAITAPATSSILAVADGKTLTASNTLTFTGTDGSSVAFGTGGTVLYSASTIPLTVGTTTIASGTNTKVFFDNSGVLGEYTISGTGNVAMTTSPTFTTPALGAATATSINGNIFTTGTYTLTGTAGKTLTFTNSITLSGTDSTTMTFPATSATVGGLGIVQTWTAQNKFNNIVDVNNSVSVTSNAGTVPITFRLSTFTNSSAATMAITMATTSAVDGQMTVVRIYDFSAVAQTIGWTNTENSNVTVPTTSNGSTTSPLTVGFQFNGATSKWRCIASA